MNLLELNQMLSTLLADSSTNFYTQSERLQALNNACSYMNSELRILRNVAYITITSVDNGKVPLPVDFVSMGNGVQWKDLNNQVSSLDMAVPTQLQSGLSANWMTESGSAPSKYVLEGSNLYLTPIPTQAGTLLLSYITNSNKLLNDEDVPFYGDVRVQAYHDAIVFYAAWQLCLKDRDFEAAQQFMGYFQNRIIDLKENLRQTGSPIQPVWADTYSTT